MKTTITASEALLKVPMGTLLPTGRGGSRNLVKQHQLLLPGSQAGGRRLLSVPDLSAASAAAGGHATIKHQRGDGSRVQFPACLLVSIYHADQFGPVFLLSSIWQNERNYGKSVLAGISFDDLVTHSILLEECGCLFPAWTDEAPRFLLEWRWKFWECLPLLTSVADCSWLPASARSFSRKRPPELKKSG